MTPASGEQLAQSRPGVTTPVSVYTATLRTEITLIVVANTDASAHGFSIYHDDDGSTFDATTELYAAKSVSGNNTELLKFEVGSGIFVKPGGQIAAQTDSASNLTITIYGHTGVIA